MPADVDPNFVWQQWGELIIYAVLLIVVISAVVALFRELRFFLYLRRW